MTKKGIGKKELARTLGWARTTLDRRLLSDPNFPVLSRGDQGGGWAFDCEAVLRYLGVSSDADQAHLPDGGSPPASQLVAPEAEHPEGGTPSPVFRPRSAHHEGEATARQRKDHAEATLRELKVAEAVGETMRTVEVQQIAGQVFAGLAGDLDALPEELARKLGLPDDAAPTIRKMIDDVRVALVKRIEPLLADG